MNSYVSSIHNPTIHILVYVMTKKVYHFFVLQLVNVIWELSIPGRFFSLRRARFKEEALRRRE